MKDTYIILLFLNFIYRYKGCESWCLAVEFWFLTAIKDRLQQVLPSFSISADTIIALMVSSGSDSGVSIYANLVYRFFWIVWQHLALSLFSFYFSIG